jgi:hypothetical protein
MASDTDVLQSVVGSLAKGVLAQFLSMRTSRLFLINTALQRGADVQSNSEKLFKQFPAGDQRVHRPEGRVNEKLDGKL